MNTKNLPLGDYPSQLPPALYARVPKAVFAAIALSPHFNGGVQLEDENTAAGTIMREWRLQHEQGLIPNPPPSDRWLAQRGIALTVTP